jgi:type IV secretion system protein VirB5
MQNFSSRVPLANPYDAAKTEWDNRMGSAIISAKNWRLAFFASVIFVCFPALIGMIITAQKSNTEPYIIEVHDDGSAKSIGKIATIWDAYTPEDGVIVHTLRNFVEKSQTIPSDLKMQRKNWADIYPYTSQKATQKMRTEWQSTIDKMEKGAIGSAYVNIESIVQLTDESWQVDWRETQFSLQDEKIADLKWRGTFQLKIRKPKTEAEFDKNPMGIYINEFHFTKVK